MAKGKRRKGKTDQIERIEKAIVTVSPKINTKTKLTKPVENKVKFLVWFSTALEKFKELKPHHMNTIRTYFINDLRLGNIDYSKVYDDGLRKFGFGRK